MAAGTPIVAAAAGGVLEIVEDGVTGVLVAPSDAAALADALERLLSDPAERERLGAAGRRRIEERFSLDVDADVVERLYREVAA
jgi:glycosyltransferase involved in cell wall biosynthesis